MKKLLLIVLSMATLTTSWAQSRPKFDRGIEKQTFIPKGQWFFGGSALYTEHTNDNYKFLLMENWSGDGYNIGIKPFVGYCIADDIGVGLSFSYDRTLLNINSMDIGLGDDLNLSIGDYSNIEQVYSGTAFLRTYINIGDSKRFGIYNDLRFMYGQGQGKLMAGKDEALKGTYQKIRQAGIIIQPGVTVFINNNVAVEASIGILGFQYKQIDQITNQVYQGSRVTNSATFKIDLLSIGLGIAFYL